MNVFIKGIFRIPIKVIVIHFYLNEGWGAPYLVRTICQI